MGMRPIDADALMESIGCADAVKYGNRDRAQQDTSYSTMMLYEIRGEIDAQPTVGGWISVKDRLPEEGVCLGCHGSSVGIYGYLFGEWFDEDNCTCGEGYVTHWMPLPEPPEEVSK